MADWDVRVQIPPLDIPAFVEHLTVIRQLVVEDLAEIAYVSLQSFIEDQKDAFPTLSDVTKWFKQRTMKNPKVRVSSGDFLRAIRMDVEDGKAQVGILIPRGSRGQDMEMLARVMEGGATVRVTSKMRRWFASQGKPLRKTTMYLRVPARPVFAPTVAEVEEQLPKVVVGYLEDALRKL